MKDCNKYNKKLIIGMVTVLFFPILIYLFELYEVNTFLSFLIVITDIIYGIYMMSPFFKCIQNNMNQDKPPHLR